MNIDDRSSLLCRIKMHAYKEGNFVLASGKMSRFYLDLKQVILNPYAQAYIKSTILAVVGEFGAKGIVDFAGEGLGGIPLALIMSQKINCLDRKVLQPFPILVRKAQKDYGTGKRVEYSKGGLEVESKVVLVEDVLTTGKSALEAVQILREDGFDVIGVVAIVDREEGARKLLEDNGLEVKSVYTLKEVIETF